MVWFGILMTSLWVATHVHVGRSLLRPSGLPAWARVAIVALLAIGAVSALLVFSAGRIWMDPPAWVRSLYIGAYCYMAGFSSLWAMIAVRDLGLLAWLRAHRGRRPTELENPARRQLFLNATGAGLTGAAIVGTGLGYHEATRLARVKPVEVRLDRLPRAWDGARIVQLSDIHVGPTVEGSHLADIVRQVNTLRPDLVVITGDLVDGLVENMREELASLRELRATHGVFYVTGNHEYYWNGTAWTKALAEMGLTVLTNEHRVLERDGAPLVIGGVTDFTAARFVPEHRSDAARALAGRDPAMCTIMLAHQPKSVDGIARAGADLQLSGHTHGGQFFPWNLVVPLVQPYTAGLYRHDERLQVYVSRGTCYWGPPVRVMAPSEITAITLRSGQA